LDRIITTEVNGGRKNLQQGCSKMAIIDMHVEAFLLVLYQVLFINILDRKKVLCTSCVWDGPRKFIFMLIISVFDLISEIGIKF
jgi:hypothetical protein